MSTSHAAPEPRRDRESSDAALLPLREVNERLVVAALREQELKEKAEGHAAEMDALLESLHDGVVVLDPAGRITMANDPARRILGLSQCSEQRATRKPLHLRLHGLDGQPVPARESPFQAALRDERFSGREYLLLQPGAPATQISFSGSAVRDDAGVVRCALAVCRDVTELRTLERLKHESEAALLELNETLERRVVERTRELTAAIETRRHVLRQLVSAEEEERRRISRELHDHFGQQLTGLLLGLAALAGEAGSSERLDDLQRLADTVARDIQSMAVELRPPALDNLELRLALQGHLEEWSARHATGASFHSSGLNGVRLPREVETTLYRVVQEGLTNVLKHARATHASLLVDRRGGAIHVILEDDGCGFDVEATLASPEKAKRLGLLGMRERVALLGGQVEVESSPGVGTTLFVRVPDTDAASDAAEGSA